MRNFLHHLEYEESGLSAEDIKKIISEKKVFYNHFADKREDKLNASIKLEKEKIDLLPEYIKENIDRFKDWID